jgi:putative ABC transport system substrate-binding protein
MKRREFITLLGGAAATWPLTAGAQQTIPTVGFLGTATEAAWAEWTGGFVKRLRELGWVEGSTISILYRWAEGVETRYSEAMAEFVRRKVDVIVTGGGALPAAKEATSNIPIIFALAPDPVGSGLVTSLARPGGNITGLSLQANDLASKRLGLLREVIPELRHFAVMANGAYAAAGLEWKELRAAAQALGLQITIHEILRAEDIAPAFQALRGRVDALYVFADPLVNSNRARIGALAVDARMPSIFAFREYVDAGGLMSYGPNLPDVFRRTGDYVDKILRGTKPADLPVEQPTKFDLVINLKTAKALGLVVPESFLLRADEVIE